MCQATYGNRRVSDVNGVRLEMRGGQIRNKAVLEYVPAAAREQGQLQVREEREVEVERLDVEAVVAVAEVADLTPADTHDFTGDMEYPVVGQTSESEQ